MFNSTQNLTSISPQQGFTNATNHYSLTEKTLASVIKIQSLIRSKLARKSIEENYLDSTLFEAAKEYVQKPDLLENLPRAFDGKTPVYLPQNLSVVIKTSGAPGNSERFEKMKKARTLCKKNGYASLTIPKARILRHFIIESRLPILKAPDAKVYYGFYLEHIEQLTKAVQEFTAFLCQTELRSITGKKKRFYSLLSQTNVGRYDNIAMYLDEYAQAKIGLIDLERFYPLASPNRERVFFACRDAICLFPKHFNTIIKEAKKFDAAIDKHFFTFRKICVYSSQFLTEVYQDHLAFVKSRNITFNDPLKLTNISTDLLIKLKKNILEKLGNEINEIVLNPSEKHDLLTSCDHEFSNIMNIISEFLNILLTAKLEICGGIEEIRSEPMLLSTRSIYFHSHKPRKDDDYELYMTVVYGEAKVFIADYLESILNEETCQLAAKLLIDITLEEMAKEGLLAKFKQDAKGDFTIIFC